MLSARATASRVTALLTKGAGGLPESPATQQRGSDHIAWMSAGLRLAEPGHLSCESDWIPE